MLPASLFGGEREASPEVLMDDSQPPNDDRHRRQSVPGRARKRAIRLHAACTGVSYTIAARRLAAGTTTADQGRTLYPVDAARARRTLAERVADARLAADLPHGRAAHLVQRFPPRDGGPDVGTLYGGAARQELLLTAYKLVIDERPDLEPSAIDLAWQAESGDETVLDGACAQLDRAVRLLLDEGFERLAAAVPSAQLVEVRIDGARQTLDALLVAGESGHVPGTRVVMLSGRPATIVGAVWEPAGPPVAYAVRRHGLAGEVLDDVLAPPQELLVLAGQGAE
ncbi:hypothetical protein AB0M47_26315 [Hamadaea sp. NPDC051192]|uniref:hypothetical protein n=1 Tax=Hamadaea sp. NPDC051192 TaxID=3154940 RepID=UPI003413C4E4